MVNQTKCDHKISKQCGVQQNRITIGFWRLHINDICFSINFKSLTLFGSIALNVHTTYICTCCDHHLLIKAFCCRPRRISKSVNFSF